MSYHILSIDTPMCSLTCSRGQLIYSDAEGRERRLPMEDIASIVITSFKATLTSTFLIEAAHARIGLVLCDGYRPASVVLPVDRATDTELLRKIASLPATLKSRLWAKTIRAKCLNQYMLAAFWLPNHPDLPKFRTVAEGSSETKESECARMFWGIFGASHATDDDFRRGRNEGGFNHLLNYAYAVLLSCILQKLLAIGLDPTFGLFHRPREHATPLAYDLMEPFRPLFDEAVSRLISVRTAEQDPETLSLEDRRTLAETLNRFVRYGSEIIEVKTVIEKVCRSFRRAVMAGQSGPYEPWITSTTKWDGSSSSLTCP